MATSLVCPQLEYTISGSVKGVGTARRTLHANPCKGGKSMSSQSTRKNRKRPLPERFWEKVNKDGPAPVHRPELGACWIWTASVNPRTGYGWISVGKSMRQSHRISWEFTNGPIPDGQCVLHRCDNSSCVNPAHLFLGTQIDNIADMVAKGRQRSRQGEKVNTAKLTAEKVQEIRERFANGETNRASLAREYGVSDVMISYIILRKSWKHI